MEVNILGDGVTRLTFSKKVDRSYRIPFGLAVVIVAVAATVELSLSYGEIVDYRGVISGLAGVLLLVMGMLFVRSKSVQTESLILFPKLGLQVVYTDGSSRFFQLDVIDFFTINEGFEHCRIVVYLALVTVQKHCLVLFNDTRPSPESLVVAFEKLDSWLTSSRAATDQRPT